MRNLKNKWTEIHVLHGVSDRPSMHLMSFEVHAGCPHKGGTNENM